MTTPEPLRIEKGGALDLPLVMQVMEDAFDAGFGEAWTAPQCAGLLPMNNVWLNLARDGRSAAGFALARIVADEAELLLLAVRRDRRRRGIGRMLLDRFCADALAGGARRFHLEVRDRNRAIALYREAGFEQVGRRPNYYRGNDGSLFDAITLAKYANV